MCSCKATYLNNGIKEPKENIEFDTLPFVRDGVPATQLTKMYDMSPESCVHGAVFRLLFMPITIMS